MSEMIDRVAKALAEHCNGGEFASAQWYNGDQRDVWRKAARAAIDATREPTAAMIAAGGGIEDGPTDAGTTWRAMIDAALGEL